jgi:hypothetical protein
MKTPLKRLITGLILATVAAAGTLAVTDSVTAHKTDTAWGAPATTTDTGWGTPPDGGLGDLPVPIPIPLDTGWG